MKFTTLFKLTVIAGVLSVYACQSTADDVNPTADDIEARANKVSESDVYTFPGELVGTSQLIRKPNSVSMSLQTSELSDGDAATIWFVVFNEPSACGTSPCAVSDIFNPDTKADVLYGSGNLIGNGNQANFGGSLKVGDTSGSIMGFFNSMNGTDLPSLGLEDPNSAEIHLVVRSHGQASSEYMPDMISSFNGGCTYPDGVPHDYGIVGTNTCANVQYAIHLP